MSFSSFPEQSLIDGRSEWNKLRASYLAYQRALNAIQEPPSTYSRDRPSHYTESDRSKSYHDSSRISDHWSNHRLAQEEEPVISVKDLDWKSARNETYAKESAEIAKAESTFPEGTVCFVRNLHLGTNKTTLKSLFNDVIETLGGIPKKDQVSYVDYESGLDSVCLVVTTIHRLTAAQAHVRFSTPGAAVAVKMYFQGRGAIMSNNDMDAVSKLSKSAEDGKPIDVEILEGQKEAIYWQKVPLSARPQKLNGIGMPQRRDDRDRDRDRKGKRKNDDRESSKRQKKDRSERV